MTVISTDKVARVGFKLKWASEEARHEERYEGSRVNYWRDTFPQHIGESLSGKQPGDHVAIDYEAGQAVPAFDPNEVYILKKTQFAPARIGMEQLAPDHGRFYPRGLLYGVPGVFSENREPFRIAGIEDHNIIADFNHPLAQRELQISATVHTVRDKRDEIGGACKEWDNLLLNGPGMQARTGNRPTDFYLKAPLPRPDITDDRQFYAEARFTTHIDKRAQQTVSEIHGRLLAPNTHVLDLMSSYRTHLPDGLELASLTGLGMNAEEMGRNPRLTDHIVHNLNKFPILPFGNHTFDTVICNASVEYLVRPAEVFTEVARVLRPGGLFVVTFSNRWFPPKAVYVWTELHEFERVGLVLDYFLKSGSFEDLHTYSDRGRIRPFDREDRYFGKIPFSDPVYAVWGRKS